MVAKYLLGAFRKSAVRLAAVKYRQLVILPRELAGDLGADKAAAADEKNPHAITVACEPVGRTPWSAADGLASLLLTG